MRRTFAIEMYSAMCRDENIVILTGDLGFGMWDKIRNAFPERFINCGASEQAMMGIAVGMALKGKKVFVYSITNFLLYRAFETIKLYLDGEKIPVRLVASGRDKDYAHDGPSHDASDAKKVLDTLPNIVQYWPDSKEEIPGLLKEMLENDKPSFISLKR